MEPEARPGLPATRIAGFYGIMAALAWVVSLIFHVPSLWHMKPRWPGPVPTWVGLGLAIAVGLGVHFASGPVKTWLGRDDDGDGDDEMAEMVGAMSAWQHGLTATLSGLVEELLFRGALLPVIGLVPSALVFGAMHLSSRKEMRYWALFAAGMGLALGLLYQATGILLAPILAHFIVNLLGIAALRKQESDAA